MTPQQQDALRQIAGAAIASERATGLPAEVSAAQCIFESGWLTRCPANNCFGIKADAHGSGVHYCLTKEFIDGTWKTESLAFEKYDSLADCFVDHARLITTLPAYAPTWQQYQRDYNIDTFILALGRIYGTDPAYGAKILAEAHSSSVTVAVQSARQEAMKS